MFCFVYSATGSLRTYTDRALHVGQVLSTEYNMFDCLSTLCELCQDLPSLLRDHWQLLMLILLPIQADLLQRSMERATLLRQYHQLDVDPDPTELIVRGRRPLICCSADQMLLTPEFHHRQHRPRCGSAYRPFPADIARCTSDQ